jgi:branched-chain amino acid transport system substrate-binding protein
MKNRRMLLIVLSLLTVLALALSACGGATPEVETAATEAPAVEPTEAVVEEPTEAPAEEPTEAVAEEPTAEVAEEPTEAPAEEPTEEAAAEGEQPFAGEEVVIGLMTDKSGALAIYGPSQTQGFYLGLEYATEGTMEVAGRPITVVEMDNSSDPDTAVTQARELIEAEGADILIGNVSSSAALATIPVAEENDVIYIAEPAAAPAITAENFSPNTFRTSRTSVQDALVMGSGLLGMGETFVQIAPDNAFGIGSACAFYAIVSGGGGQFTTNDTAEGCGTIYAPIETTDFTSYINQILDSGADVLIVSWAGAGFAPMFQQMSQLGVFDEMTVGTGVGDNQTLAAGYADALGVVGIQVYHYTLPNNEINDWLVERHMEEYGTPPDLWASGGMMAAIMAVEGLKATNGDSSAEALRTVYEDNFSFEGPKGTTTIRGSDHVALQTLYFVRVVSVTDPEFRFVELVEEFGPEMTEPPCGLVDPYADRCTE